MKVTINIKHNIKVNIQRGKKCGPIIRRNLKFKSILSKIRAGLKLRKKIPKCNMFPCSIQQCVFFFVLIIKNFRTSLDTYVQSSKTNIAKLVDELKTVYNPFS